MEIMKEYLKEITQEHNKDVNENEEQDSIFKSQSIFTVVGSSPQPIIPEFTCASDMDFTTQTWRVKSEVQAGQVSGHFLRIHGGKVSADSPKNDKAKLKIHCFYDDELEQDLWIFESSWDEGKVIAIKNDKVIVKDIGVQESLTSITQVQASHPEIIFIKKPISKGSTVFTLRSANASIASYLGFDKINGSAMVPSKVRPSQKEAKFRIFLS